MKPLLILPTAFLLAITSCAQGYVAFNNLWVDAPIFMPDGTGPGAAGKAQLYLFTEGGYSPVGPIRGFLTISPEATYYIHGTRVSIPEIPAPLPATLQIRAWVDAPNWESAVIRGESNDVTVNLSADLESAMEGLQSFTLIPEPSMISLGLFGAAAMALARRRQRPKTRGHL